MIVELDKTALKDLKKLDRVVREKVVKGLKQFESSESLPDNLDIKQITGSKPWLRLRIGMHRILLRKMNSEKYLVHRIIHRKDLDREAAKLH